MFNRLDKTSGYHHRFVWQFLHRHTVKNVNVGKDPRLQICTVAAAPVRKVMSYCPVVYTCTLFKSFHEISKLRSDDVCLHFMKPSCKKCI